MWVLLYCALRGFRCSQLSSLFTALLLLLILAVSAASSSSADNPKLDASFLLYDGKDTHNNNTNNPIALTKPRLEFLSVSQCDIAGGFYPCYKDVIGAMVVRIQSDDTTIMGNNNNVNGSSAANDDDSQALEFRFFGKSGGSLLTDTWLTLDTCHWFNLQVSENFPTFVASLAHNNNDKSKNIVYKRKDGGRFRFRDLTIRPGCNGIESFAVEFQLNQDRYDDKEEPIQSPLFGWIAFNQQTKKNHTTNDHHDHDNDNDSKDDSLIFNFQDILQEFHSDQSRTSVSTLEPAASSLTEPTENSSAAAHHKSVPKVTFPSTYYQTSSIECVKNSHNLTDLFLWLGEDNYIIKLQAPEGSFFKANQMYQTYGRNNRRHVDQKDIYARVSVEGPNGKGPLNLGRWCSEFQGRVMFRELQVYDCYQSCFRSNLALEVEQYCIDNATNPHVDVRQWTWGSIRINSTIPPNTNLSSVFLESSEPLDEENLAADSSTVDSGGANENETIALIVEKEEMKEQTKNEEGDERHLVRGLSSSTSPSIFARLLSLRLANQTVQFTFDGIERLGLVSRRMCAALEKGGGYDSLPCVNDNQATGLEFSLVVDNDDDNNDKGSSAKKRPTRYHVQLFAPTLGPFQPNYWYERVTAHSFDGCTSAHFNIDDSLYNVGLTPDNKKKFPKKFDNGDDPFINFGRFIFRELEIRPGCSGIDRLAVDIQLHRNFRTAPPVFVFVRYQSTFPVEETEIVDRWQRMDVDNYAASMESTSPEVWFANLTQTIARRPDSSAPASSNTTTANGDVVTIREFPFHYIETGAIYGECDAETLRIQGFEIQLRAENNADQPAEFGIMAPNDDFLVAQQWYAATNVETTGYGHLNLYGYPNCEQQIGAFFIHELQLRDCCALFGNFAIDYLSYCVEPVVKSPIYGWIRFNSSVPIDKNFMVHQNWTVKDIQALVSVDAVSGQPTNSSEGGT